MVYYNCKYGYRDGTDRTITNLSDITFVEDGYFPILEGFDGIYETKTFPDVEGWYAYCKDKLGTNVNLLFSMPPSNYGPSEGSTELGNYRKLLEEMIEYFPSVRNGAPNSFNLLFEDLTFLRQWGIYIPSLNRVIFGDNGSRYKVNSDGSLTYNGSSKSIAGLYAGRWTSGSAKPYVETSNLFIDKFTSVNDLFDQVLNDKTSLVRLRHTTYSTPPYVYITDKTYANTLIGFLFEKGVSPEPDGSYTPVPDDPYGPGGNSGEGDLPPGTFDDTSDAIPDSSLPTISAADTGFTRIYNPTLAQVQSLAKYLWTDDTVLDTIWNHIKQFFEDPMQAIIGFNLVPCRVPDGGTRDFALMYINTGVQMTAAANQFVDVDCGTVKLERYYGSALDQNPYTKISCFLPYIGTVHLDTDEVMGTTLQVKYRIDIVSGSCVAKILVDGNVLYQYSGHCAITVPISSADFATYVSAAVSVGAVAAGLAAGAAAGIGVGAAESEALTVTSAEMSAPITASEASALIGGESSTGVASGASFNGINAANITNTVGQVMGSKLQIEHAGSFSGNSGYLGVRRPYLIINRPNMCLPSLYGHLNGYPSMITLNLGDCSGFTKVQQVQLTGVTATNPEQSEILQFLKSGVYL